MNNLNGSKDALHYEAICYHIEEKAIEEYNGFCIDICDGLFSGYKRSPITALGDSYEEKIAYGAKLDYEKYLDRMHAHGITANESIRSRTDFARFRAVECYVDYNTEKEYKEALTSLIEIYGATGKEKKQREARIRLADLYYALCEYEQAEKAYAEAQMAVTDPYQIKKFGDHYRGKGKKDEAVSWYERYPSEDLDIKITRYVADYYSAASNKERAAVWYERSLKRGFDAEIAAYLGKYYSDESNKEKFLNLLGICEKNGSVNCLDKDGVEGVGDVFLNEGRFDEALICYKASGAGDLKLAECYFYSGKPDLAKAAIADHAKQTELVTPDKSDISNIYVRDGFILHTAGMIFIGRDNHLIPVDKKYVKALKIENADSSDKKSAILYLKEGAPEGLSDKITLLDGQSNAEEVCEALENTLNDKKITKDEKISREASAKKAKPRLKQMHSFGRKPRREHKAPTLDSNTLISAIGSIFIYLLSGLGIFEALYYSFSNSDGESYWFIISAVPFIINTVILRLTYDRMPKKSAITAIVVIFSTLIIQHIINGYLQWWLWLDPNDGEPCPGEFAWYGVIRPLIYTAIYTVIFFVVLNFSDREKKVGKRK